MTDHLTEIVETAQGPMLLLKTDTVISKSIRENGDYAREEKVLLAELLAEGDTAVDVGANIGSHTLFFARQVGGDGRVYSFEAQRFLFQILCANVALNSLRNVWCVPSALGNRQGRVAVSYTHLFITFVELQAKHNYIESDAEAGADGIS